MSDQDSTFRWYEGEDDRPTGWFAEGGAPRRSRVGRPTSRATYLEPARGVPVHAETDILVVGGGPAGCAAAALVETLQALNDDLEVPTLPALGVERSHFDLVKESMAEAALASGSPGFNPRVPEAAEIVELYNKVYG